MRSTIRAAYARAFEALGRAWAVVLLLQVAQVAARIGAREALVPVFLPESGTAQQRLVVSEFVQLAASVSAESLLGPLLVTVAVAATRPGTERGFALLPTGREYLRALVVYVPVLLAYNVGMCLILPAMVFSLLVVLALDPVRWVEGRSPVLLVDGARLSKVLVGFLPLGAVVWMGMFADAMLFRFLALPTAAASQVVLAAAVALGWFAWIALCRELESDAERAPAPLGA